MKFHTMRPQTLNPAQIRFVSRAGHRSGVRWINRYLDREYVRRVADTTLRTWAYNSCTSFAGGESSSYRRRGGK